MNFLQSCGSLFAGASLFEDPDDSDDSDDDPWRSIQTHKGEIVLMRPENAETIDPQNYAAFPAVHLVHEDPSMWLCANFLDDDMISHIASLCPGRWKHSRVGLIPGDYKKGQESQVRTSSSCTLRRGETPIVRELERRVCELAGIDFRYLENLAPVFYEPGEQYRPHHDGSARPVTVFIYMSDVEEGAGGETYFPVLDLKVKPRKGSAIMWKNPLDADAGYSKDNEDTRMLHAALPVLKGTKFGLNCFFNCKPQDKDEASPLPQRSVIAPQLPATAVRPPAGPSTSIARLAPAQAPPATTSWAPPPQAVPALSGKAVSWVPPPQAVPAPPRIGFAGLGSAFTARLLQA